MPLLKQDVLEQLLEGTSAMAENGNHATGVEPVSHVMSLANHGDGLQELRQAI